MALSAPKQQTGDQLNPADVENHTLVLIPTQWEADVPTEYSKPGEPSPCIRVNVADLSDAGGVPVVYRGVMWWNAFLQGGLKRQIGETILARMTLGQKSPGKNAPWQLLDVLTEADWVNYATSWLATPEGKEFEEEGQREAAQATSGVVSPAAAPAAAAAPPPPPPAPAPAPVAAPPASPPPAPAPAAPPAAAPAPVAAPAANPADPLAILAAMPEEERAKYLAIFSQQGQAAH